MGRHDSAAALYDGTCGRRNFRRPTRDRSENMGGYGSHTRNEPDSLLREAAEEGKKTGVTAVTTVKIPHVISHAVLLSFVLGLPIASADDLSSAGQEFFVELRFAGGSGRGGLRRLRRSLDHREAMSELRRNPPYSL